MVAGQNSLPSPQSEIIDCPPQPTDFLRQEDHHYLNNHEDNDMAADAVAQTNNSNNNNLDETSADESHDVGRSNRKNTEPPRNADGKIICTHPNEHANCAGLTFERKCEWSKHMDKHDRPYVCEEPGCEKLRGFTYSGGLLRHKREVHKMHGGPKEMLNCPYPYCKRSAGHGFTRRENLNEHMRRVHRMPDASELEGESKDGQVSANGLLPAAAYAIPIPIPPIAPMQPADSGRKSRKRKAGQSAAEQMDSTDQQIAQMQQVPASNIDPAVEAEEQRDLREEVKRLRLSNDEKDRQISQLKGSWTHS